MSNKKRKMLFNKILKLGNPQLYKRSSPIVPEEILFLKNEINLLHDLILECQKLNGFGRGIAAPQIGLMKRIVCLNLKGKKYTLFNPVLNKLSKEEFELWDDCMCFPDLLVKVKRHQSCRLIFQDENWKTQTWEIKNDLSELLQHECDHLDGILATQRAIDTQSFKLKN